MTVRPEDIAIERCYVTAGEQVRKVISVSRDGKVLWLSQEKVPGSATPVTMSTMLKKFAAEVEHEVRCDDAE